MSVVDAFVNELDLADLGLEGVQAAKPGRPSFHPMVPLAIHVDGDLDRVHLSRRLGRECQRNPEWMWLTGRPAPDLKTIADFRRDREKGIHTVGRIQISKVKSDHCGARSRGACRFSSRR